MASLRSPSSPSDGYKRFSDDFANTSINNYGSNVTNNRAAAETGAGAGAGPDAGAGADGTLELGSRSSLHGGLPMTEDEHWEMNYHEAAIYLEEGLNNEKFDSHPSSAEQLPAYLRVHNPWYHGLDLLASLVLILLAFSEDPAVPAFKLPVWAHGTIELLALGVIGVELQLKLKWIGWGTILKHKRTMIKGITLLIMVLEAVVVLCRQSSHFRVTRALRPIFLVDTRHCGGVRRFIRQILQSLPPIIDMLGLLMFFVATYSLLGYYLFSEHVDNGHFQTLSDSFVSMFVLLTTANFPDVMMPSYAKSKWYAVFFILYIITVLYVLMNLMLAVVYETFTRIERDKCRALLLHRRGAARRAFRLLVSRRAPGAVRLRHFAGLLRHYAPHYDALDVYLMFKQLNRSGSGALSRGEFAALYDALSLRWSPQAARAPWYAAGALEPAGRAAAAAVDWPYFEHLVYALIVGNGVAMVLRVCEAAGGLRDSARLLCASWDTWLFLTLFLAEAGVRMLAAGLPRYLASGWNVFDLSATLLALLGAVLLSAAPDLFVVVIFRPLRLMRLYKLKKRYRDVFGTLVLLSPLMSSAGCVMLVVYYFFAIVGMELFAGADLKNCCVNTTVEDFYKWSSNGSTALGYYYLNNFENLLTSGVTLFELTVVNNWFILMNAYATVVGQFTRIYFMVFYLFTMVVLTIVVASVLEAFRFRIQYKRSTTKRDGESSDVPRRVFYLFTMVVLTIVVASVLEAFRFRIQYKRSTTKRDGESSDVPRRVFYLFTMVVLTIVVASVLEAFRFRIQYKRSTTKRDGESSDVPRRVFYLFTMVVLTIVVASVLEAFRFRIQYKRSTTKRDGESSDVPRRVFYLFTMVVLTIVVASVLEAFRFRIQYKRSTTKRDGESSDVPRRVFYLFTMVVLTIVVASVLEAFRFRIQYKRSTTKRDGESSDVPRRVFYLFTMVVLTIVVASVLEAFRFRIQYKRSTTKRDGESSDVPRRVFYLFTMVVLTIVVASVLEAFRFRIQYKRSTTKRDGESSDVPRRVFYLFTMVVLTIVVASVLEAFRFRIQYKRSTTKRDGESSDVPRRVFYLFTMVVLTIVVASVLEAFRFRIQYKRSTTKRDGESSDVPRRVFYLFTMVVLTIVVASVLEAFRFRIQYKRSTTKRDGESSDVPRRVFYLFTMVVLTIVVASVLEAFRFRIQYKRSTTKRDGESSDVPRRVFYLFTMVVLTIVVASVLEAFRFRIQYKRSTTKRDGESSDVPRRVFYLFTMVVLTIVVASVLEAFRFRIQYKRSTTKRDGESSDVPRRVFYLFTMVVLTIVVASVLEAFRFRIQYKRSTTKRDEEKLLHEEVHTSWEEAQRLGAGGALAERLRAQLPPGAELTFIGTRPRTKEVLQRRMYQSEIQKWLAEDDDGDDAPALASGDAPAAPTPGAASAEPEAQRLRAGYQL